MYIHQSSKKQTPESKVDNSVRLLPQDRGTGSLWKMYVPELQ